MLAYQKASYCIYSLLEEFKSELNRLSQLHHCFWIIDGQLQKAAWLEDLIQNNENMMFLPAGESCKTWQTLQAILEELVTRDGGHSKSIEMIIAIGGGACLDTAALAAHLFKRGIRLTSVPTTVLAMVDASIGGKCAINWRYYKNMIGAYHFPERIITSYAVLGTEMNHPIVMNGLSEAYKHALIDSEPLLLDIRNFLHNPNINLLTTIIPVAASIKEKIVELDQQGTTSGIRHLLNLGHTVAHGLEFIGYSIGLPISHAQAVAIGLIVESWIFANQNQELKKRWHEIAKDLIQLAKPWPCLSQAQWSLALEAMNHDKKRIGKGIALSRFGQLFNMVEPESTYLVEVTHQEMTDAWRACEQLMA